MTRNEKRVLLILRDNFLYKNNDNVYNTRISVSYKTPILSEDWTRTLETEYAPMSKLEFKL